MTDKKNGKSFWTGLIAGAIISIITSLITIWVQHSLTIKEKNIQLYLDEKKDFVAACDDYLKQYRQWHELMNYAVYKDTTSEFTEFRSAKIAAQSYIQWKKDIDFAYGKIFMLSDNEFGTKTLEVSTVLHASLTDLLENNYSQDIKTNKLKEIDIYFFENWLTEAQKEIFRFNTGERKQKTIKQYIEEKTIETKNLTKEELDSQEFESLSKAHKYIERKDSLLKSQKSRIPTKQEVKKFMERKNN